MLELGRGIVAKTARGLGPALLVDLAAGAGIATVLIALDPGARDFGGVAVILLWWGSCVTQWSGLITLRLFGVGMSAASPLLAFVTGAAVVAHVLLLGSKIVGVPAGPTFLVWGCIVTAIALSVRVRERETSITAWAHLGLLLMCCGITLAWSWRASSVVETMRATGRFFAWSDYFIHAGEIASFMGSLAFGRGPISLVDAPGYLYHFGSYALPAVVADLTGATPLGAALSSWLSLSFLLLFAGTALLGAVLGGVPVAIVALALVAAAPDASLYGLKNGFFGFHWLLVTSPGSGYAIGLGTAALALVVLWTRDRKPGLLAASAMLVAAAFMFRIHIFALLVPVWAAAVLLATAPIHRVFAVSALTSVALAVLSIPLFLLGCPLCESLHYDPAVNTYLQIVHSNSTAISQPGWLHRLVESGPAGGILLLLFAAFGIPICIYTAYLVGVALGRRCDAVAMIPALFIVAFVGVTVFAPVPWHGDVTDLKQRGFVVVYDVLAIWTALALVGIARWLQMPRLAAQPILGLIAAAAVACPAIFADALAGPHLAWAGALYGTSVDLGLVSVADYIRHNERRGDVFAMDKTDPQEVLTDDATRLSSLTGMPAFVSRAGILSDRSPTYARIIRERTKALADVNSEKDVIGATTRLNGLGVRWFLVGGGRKPMWDPDGRFASFRAGSWLVYH